MNCKADLTFSNIYADEVNKVLAKMQKASAVDKMNIRRMVSELTTDYGRMMFDFAAMLALITMVEDFGFGTGENAKRIPRFVKAMQERMDDYTERMEECAPQHAWNKLRDHGIDYHVSATPWTKKGFKSHD
jgi:hypothetical protein